MTGKVYVRVYWEDTDAGGVVYHTSYLRFMERGRTELLRERGIDQGVLQADRGLIFVVSQMNIRFRASAKLDDELTIETAVKEAGGASLVIAQRILRGSDVLTEAEVLCAMISREGKPMRFPPDIRQRLG